ncbi:type II toxin-antitoxin system RelE/ParE family toxin [Sphaerochaeta sp. S2]|uniref:type II toxin-antitoxin system RelE/ParE family toxin n=2 Tax=unclassified Sphaerochaeta TaxID=2637943 RepID=UPI0018E94E16|nr:hypothetical protein [Sphaerochaeta sp. S2]MBJ2355214.1 hypothetical protein [Sphaerochaeta sp. S2]MCK9348443.1 hypothetical protein [Sphaerochaeta sp.]MDD4301553.1 hypothetical protein [Sphaerochaeta sp.]MDY0244726.1 hypothetical protein [Sphaerochaeta sp.]
MGYEVIVSRKADEMLVSHVRFLAQVSIPAAKVLRNEFCSVLVALKDNPFQFQLEEDLGLPSGKYRRVVFAKRYKAVFSVFENSVFIDAIIDCRQSMRP